MKENSDIEEAVRLARLLEKSEQLDENSKELQIAKLADDITNRESKFLVFFLFYFIVDLAFLLFSKINFIEFGMAIIILFIVKSLLNFGFTLHPFLSSMLINLDRMEKN